MKCNPDYPPGPQEIKSHAYEIPTRITKRNSQSYLGMVNRNLGRTVRQNHYALKILKKMKPPKRYDIPSMPSANVRSLPEKVDEIEQIALLNSVESSALLNSGFVESS